ncbi:DUF4178 domain-containing protein [Uliginosibacterium aquaticum]|uniref:DUF4178 domain-containing protein n=1 Tax=Uliginosibacterium aquaticum TaxID=2731212 RepID=A0ABX2IPK4_9RHOO|nr:DUF4178 domain-containing protein [Uliginosibacterium aquaticum]NSL56055.1 DUF4178 domain-containing protein [Uliginosibacterium aquaticum]
MAVCAYCRSTLLREADAVRSIGRMSDIVEDHTRLQITSCGQYQGTNFSVVGRIQLRYDDGFWNEWYLLFDDGSAGWLADGSGQYVITRPGGTPGKAPAFETIRPNATIPFKDERYTATDVRTAQCTGGEGELPFQVGAGWQARVADFRNGDKFLTLDYSESDTPQVFLGEATSLEALKCQLLREEEQVASSAGKLKGKARTLECPACGSGIDTVPGRAEHLVCPACHAEVALSAEKAEVLALHKELAQFKSTLQLGDKATIDRSKWQLIGLMRVRETGEEPDPPWTEYLLFNAGKGFLWLVESHQGWSRTEVLNALPEITGGAGLRFGGKGYTKKWTYGAEVIYAAGAFNWRVKIGDQSRVTDYYGPDGILCEEVTAQEVTWSRSREVDAAQVARWFGKPADSLPTPRVEEPPSELKSYALGASLILLSLNFDQIVSFSPMVWIVSALALMLLWLPTWVTSGTAGSSDAGGGDWDTDTSDSDSGGGDD